MESTSILVADAGGTKISWVAVNKQTKDQKVVETTGVNAFFFTEDQIHEMLEAQLYPNLDGAVITDVHYYGAGCSVESNCEKISRAIKRHLKDANVNIYTDVLGSARGLCGKEKGVACIIGTGSSACYFDGNDIATSREGLGYALGDEGGGAHIGKLLLQRYIFKHFDDELRQNFIKKFGELTRTQILEHIYKKDAPNQYLGSFAVFASENRDHAMIKTIVKKAIGEFIDISVVGLADDMSVPINFVGSIALVFKDIVNELLNERGLKSGKFLKNPIEGLVAYHI